MEEQSGKNLLTGRYLALLCQRSLSRRRAARDPQKFFAALFLW